MINIALFGLGRIGIMHGKNLLGNKYFNLKYVYDVNKKLTQKVSKILKSNPINNPSIAFKDKKINAVFIASTTSTHIKLIIEGVKNNKAIFCEKPLDLNINKIEQCKKIIKEKSYKIQIGFNRRYDPGHNDLKKQLLKGKIGKLEKIIITSRDPSPPSIKYLKESGGIFRDMMIHDFDLVRFYLGKDEPLNLISTGSNISDYKFNKIKDHELACCIIKSRKGVQCVITNSRHCSFGYDQRVELFGSKGMLISGNKRLNETSLYLNNSTSNKAPLMNFFIDRYDDAYKNQLNDFSRFIKKNVRPLAEFEEGRKALIMANAAKKSIQTKKLEKINFS
tara:strand:+ start:2062 stop:3066 length:1005 start_codon:yes stop_codon:yes gene_type:complete